MDRDKGGAQSSGRMAKRVRFPKGKKEASGDLMPARKLTIVEGEEELIGTVLSTNPLLAAKERAMRRTALADQLISSEDTSVIDDVAAAEEEEGEDRTEDGIEIEPFNLNQEREEGYFDAEGNYVEYRNDDEHKDAWFESTEVDKRFAGKLKEKEKAEEEDAELTTEEIWRIKRRISDALLPEETVLHALRRLKGSSMKEGKRGERLSGSNKIIFDQLTEDSVKLMDNGDYNVYHEVKETFQREAEGYEALLRAKKGDDSGVHNDKTLGGMNGNSTQLDIFGDNDDSEDMFGSAEVNLATTNEGQDAPSVSDAATSNGFSEGSGYVYDETSGYYYNHEVGYYYDQNSGLFCNAVSGKWFSYDEGTNSYNEVPET
ncbi:unnamed protein product [Sphagnum jensenii]|uniref:OCRE domain-containing protein n=1 Tax=Sphagnum jensenii TaxID=128206 RepID=A0ABP0VMH2_9BRYO